MKLEEAISHCKEVAKSKCDSCGAEHEQLAEWLIELKECREQEDKGDGESMTLWDFLGTCQYNQGLYIYLVNDYGEYLPVYHGTKQDIDFWEDNIFEVLQNKIEVFGVLPDGSMQVEVRDTYFDKPMREQFNKDRWDYWKEHPDKAPWGDWTDTEAYCQIAHRESRWFSGRNRH